MLGAVDDPVITILAGGCFHAANVRPGIGFGHRQGIHPLTPHGGQQIAFLLVALTGHQDILRAAKEMGQRHGTAPQFTFKQGKFQMVQPAAPDLLRKVGGIEPHVDDFPFDIIGQFFRHKALLFHLGFMGVDLALDKIAHGINDHLLFFGKAKLHNCLPPLRFRLGADTDGGPARIRHRQARLPLCNGIERGFHGLRHW